MGTSRTSTPGGATIRRRAYTTYRARYYSAAIGRFLQTDPVGYTADINLYAYVGNDPVNMTDPMGLTGNNSTQGACDPKTGVCETVVVTGYRTEPIKSGTWSPPPINDKIGSCTKNGVNNTNRRCRLVEIGELSFGLQVQAELKAAFAKLGGKLDAGTFRFDFGWDNGWQIGLHATQEFSTTGELGPKENFRSSCWRDART